MNDTLQVISDFLVGPSVDWNLQQERYWGVMFHKKDNGTLSVYSASAYYIIEIEDVRMEPENEFYSFFEKAWMKNLYPYPECELADEFTKAAVNVVGHVNFPVTNMINMIGKMPVIPTELYNEDGSRIFEDTKKKSRIIMSQGILDEGDLIVKFRIGSNGRLEYQSPSVPMPITVSPNSIIPHHLVIPDTVYKGRIVGNTETEILVSVVEPYGKVRMGIHYSPSAFVPTDMPAIEQLRSIPQERILCTNQLFVSQVPMPTLHVDCSMFNDVIKVFCMVNSTQISMMFGPTENHPILMTNHTQLNAGIPKINILFHTLNPKFGVQRR